MLCVFQYNHPNLGPFLPFSKKLLFSLLILFLLEHTGVIVNSYPLCESVSRPREARRAPLCTLEKLFMQLASVYSHHMPAELRA